MQYGAAGAGRGAAAAAAAGAAPLAKIRAFENKVLTEISISGAMGTEGRPHESKVSMETRFSRK